MLVRGLLPTSSKRNAVGLVVSDSFVSHALYSNVGNACIAEMV